MWLIDERAFKEVRNQAVYDCIKNCKVKDGRHTTPSPSNEYVVRPNPNKASFPKAPC
jgi:hypothetical protein